MHWLRERLEYLHGLADRFVLEKRRTAADPTLDGEREAREAFTDALRELVEEIVRRPGVTAAFVSHDGLVFAAAGHAPDFEALTGLAQLTLVSAKRTANGLALGPLRQMVLIGEDHKLALFLVGQMAMGVLSPADTNLSIALGR